MTARTKKTAHEMTYNERRSELDDVLAKLQHPDCDADEAVGLYETALRLIIDLEAHLQRAENKVEKVQADFDSAADTNADGIIDRGAGS